MSDNVELNAGSGGDIAAAHDIGGVKYQRIKLIHGADGVSAGDVSTANPLPVGDAGGSLTVDGTVAATQSGTWNVGTITTVTNVVHVDDNSSTLSVDDGGGSITIDNTTLAVVGGGTEATALRVTLATDSTGVVSVDDNGSTLSVDDGAGFLTVDGSVTVTQGTATNLKAQAETYQGGAAVSSSNPLEVTLANTAANATAVKVDGSAVTQPVSIATNTPSTSTVTRVADSATSVQLLAANASRKGCVLMNDSDALVYVKFGTTATSTDYTIRILPGGSVGRDVVHGYTGRIDGIWASAPGGGMQVTELT